jgi:zinc protease
VEELKKAITNFESEEFYAMETIEGVARKAGSLENLMGDYAYFKKFLKQVYALKPEDLMKAARKYLTPETATLVLMTPRDEKTETKRLQTWAKGFAKAYAEAKKAPVKKAPRFSINKVQWGLAGAPGENFVVEKHVLSCGTTVIFRPNHATPVFSAKAAYLGGLRLEKDGQGGLTELLSRVWTSGTKDLSEAEIQHKIETMAGGISAFGGRNSAGLSMQTITPFENEAIKLFEEILAEPVISQAAVEREKVVMLEQIRSREDNPGQVVSQLFTQTMFAGHPYERDMLGSAESVKALSKIEVEGHLSTMAQASNLMIVVSGGIDIDKWLKSLEAAAKRLPKGKSMATNFAHTGITRNQQIFKQLEREQTHIIIGYKGLTLSDPRRYTLQVMQSILAGQGGRLFIELRDKASLAYSVAPMRMEGVDTGYFGAYIGCSPAKGEKAIAMLNEEFRRLVEERVPTAEIERAKRYLIGRHDIDLQRNSAISSAILFNEIYGIPSDEVFEYAEHLKGITAEDIQNLAREIFAQPHVLSAVGPTKPF